MHVYRRTDEGEIIPCHYVPMTKDPNRLRPTRISDYRKWRIEGMEVYPSVTEIIGILAKPGLESWKIDQHLWQAYHLAYAMEFQEWAHEVKRLTELELDKAPQAGTDIHGKLEKFCNRELSPNDEHYRLCMDVFDTLNEHTGLSVRDWTPEYRFVSARGFGGQIDLVSDDWIVDFKTKSISDKFKPGKMVYDDHRMQLAACRYGVVGSEEEATHRRAANLFIDLESGELDFHELSHDELEIGWAMFSSALAFWDFREVIRQLET